MAFALAAGWSGGYVPDQSEFVDEVRGPTLVFDDLQPLILGHAETDRRPDLPHVVSGGMLAMEAPRR